MCQQPVANLHQWVAQVLTGLPAVSRAWRQHGVQADGDVQYKHAPACVVLCKMDCQLLTPCSLPLLHSSETP